MKKSTILLVGAILIAGFSSAQAAPKKAQPVQQPSLIRCAVWIVPAYGCSIDERMIGGAILTASVGIGIGAIWGAMGLGAAIGGGTGAVAPLIVR